MNEHQFDALPPVNVGSGMPEQSQPAEAVRSVRTEGVIPNAAEQPGQGFINPATAPTNTTTGIPLAPADPSVPPMQGAVSAPAIADDVDLIEKEWVEKAKRIVEQTKHDPHQQNKEMNHMKASYLKKRYNYDIKAEGE